MSAVLNLREVTSISLLYHLAASTREKRTEHTSEVGWSYGQQQIAAIKMTFIKTVSKSL